MGTDEFETEPALAGQMEPDKGESGAEVTATSVEGPDRGGQRYPILTWLACAGCLLVFLGLVLEPNTDNWEALSKWGYYPPDEIRAGAYWALVSSVFVHLQLWHVAFNVYWLYVLGGPLEKAIGSIRWLAFFLTAAVVSSGWEFAITDSTGIGASGVVYGVFGFLLATRSRFPGFRAVLDRRTVVWFLGWLVGCLALTWSGAWDVGNAAHFSGLIFGAGIGGWLVLEKWRPAILTGIGALATSALVPLFWAPWSFNWTSEQGNRDYEKANYQSAVKWYRRSLDLGQNKVWCWENLALAYDALGDETHYHESVTALRTLDPKAADGIEAEVAKGGRE